MGSFMATTALAPGLGVAIVAALVVAWLYYRSGK